MSARFAHLHLHSEYSLTDSTIRLPELVKACASRGLPAVAVTDQSNLFALVKFYKAAQSAGIKPIAGADVLAEMEDGSLAHFTLLCRDRQGYLNLSQLLTAGWLDGHQGDHVRVKSDWIETHAEGLFLLAGRRSDIGRLVGERKFEHAEAALQRWRKRFDDRCCLELSRSGFDDEALFNQAAQWLAARQGCAAIISNDVRFIDQDGFDAHEARVCIASGRQLSDPRRPRDYREQQYLRSAQEMHDLFNDLPEALDNTLDLAVRCNLELRLGTYFLPAFPVPDDHTLDSWIRAESHRGLKQRLARHPLAEGHQREDYSARLDIELDVICRMGFPGYFLIVADFINWAKQNDIPVGPGRGSGAGSLVAWALGITDLDPIPYDLLFERFLNPERVSMPDFDIDFCMDRRDEVIAYVGRKYGHDRVSQIITYGTMAAKAAVRDCGRVLGLPFPAVDSIAKLIPNTLGISLDDALGRSDAARKDNSLSSAELLQRYESEDEVREVLDLALKLEDLTRNAGKHAGGVVIAPQPLTEFSPLFAEPPPKDGSARSVVTQFDKDDVEAVGLVKFDFLGLRTLTIIDWAVKAINARRAAEGSEPLDIIALPLDDRASYELLSRGDTVAVFQFESRGMRELLKRAKPDRFEDIIALAALYRPGPLGSGMHNDWVDRKHGVAAVSYPHASLEPVLAPTYGVIVYQEQVMQIAQVLAGYSLGGADLLRRAMGKKKPEEMAKERAKFEAGAAERGVDPQVATGIFDLMEKFAEYGFNKSHSAAYALVAYQTAWLKAHYPAEFMAAVMSSDMDKTEKVVTFLTEAKLMTLQVSLPHVNRSGYHFRADSPTSILYGLGAIKGMGHDACLAIETERQRGGPFTTLLDLCQRVELLRRNKRSLETLIAAGALDGLANSRATLEAQLPEVLRAVEQHARELAMGQHSLFGGGTSTPITPPSLPELPEKDLQTRLEDEFRVLGHYVSGHPMDPWRGLLQNVITCTMDQLDSAYAERKFARGTDAAVFLAGIVGEVRRGGDSRGFVQLGDGRGQVEVAFFSEIWAQSAPLLKAREIILVDGSLQEDRLGEGYSLRARKVYTLAQLCEQHAKHLLLRVDNRQSDVMAKVETLLDAFRPGTLPMQIDLLLPDCQGRLLCTGEQGLRSSLELARRLRELEGVQAELRLQRPDPTPLPDRRAPRSEE